MFNPVKSYLIHNADQNKLNSISSEQRQKRFEFFLKFCEPLEKPVTILDLGGSDYYWRNLHFQNKKDFHITLINTENQNTGDFKNISFIKRDVRDLSFFDDREYEVVYSNSLIEHLNNFEEQKNLADEIRRIGRHYFIQTPNYYFPVEPHFLFPFFQFFSKNVKTKLISKFDMGWYKKEPDKEKAEEIASSIRLLKKDELKQFFPDGEIFEEKYLLLNKSFIIYK